MVVCLSVSPVRDRRPVQGVPCLSAYGSWDRLQPSHNPKLDTVSGRKKTDGCLLLLHSEGVTSNSIINDTYINMLMTYIQ